MVKTRKTTDIEPTASKPEQSQIKDFASRAEVGEYRPRPSSLDRNAARKFKTITIPLNQYEFETLVAAADKDGRSKLGFLRRSMLQAASKLLDDE